SRDWSSDVCSSDLANFFAQRISRHAVFFGQAVSNSSLRDAVENIFKHVHLSSSFLLSLKRFRSVLRQWRDTTKNLPLCSSTRFANASFTEKGCTQQPRLT